MNTKWKVIIGALTIVAASTYLAFVGATTSWQYYVTVDECMLDGASFVGRRMRVNGQVDASSLGISEDRQQATFVLRGKQHKLHVACMGPIPDNLAGGMDVVVEGVLENPQFLRGHRVITRCASKYQPQDAQR
jgi:cytochrome c-type biogenesis protein CcmE